MNLPSNDCKRPSVTALVKIAVLMGALAILVGCGSEAESDIELVPGQGEFLRWCGSCHGNQGQGKPPAFPPLAGSEWMALPDRGLAMIILYGLRGEIEVAGRTYRGYMPPMTHLPDQDIAQILDFATRTWAGRESSLTAEDIAVLRTGEDTRPLNGRAGLEQRLEQSE